MRGGLWAALAMAGALAGCSSAPAHRSWANDGYEPRPTAGVMVDGVGQVLDVRNVWLIQLHEDAASEANRVWMGHHYGHDYQHDGHDYQHDGHDHHHSVTALVPGRVTGQLLTDGHQAEHLLERVERKGGRIVEGQELTISAWDGRELRLVSFFGHEFSPGDKVTIQGRDSYYVLRLH
jgi:ABC-type nickel/cobalt efflux system permease component RcnA